MTTSFVHLRVHSEFSFVDSVISIDRLISKSLELSMPAVALTDQSNICAAVKFFQRAVNVGIKPIMGSDVWIENQQNPTSPTQLTLIAINDQGFHHLMMLLSRGYTEGRHLDKAILKRDWVFEVSDGLIALSGAMYGAIGLHLLAGKSSMAETELADWMSCFDNRFYLELQRIGKAHEEKYIHQALTLAQEKHCPVVATNPVCFLGRDDFEAHETRVCIGQSRILADSRRPRDYTEQQYFLTQQEMQERFSDLPEALENSVEIAKRCNVKLVTGKVFLPNYPVPNNLTLDDYLIQQAESGLRKRLESIKNVTKEQHVDYQNRLSQELDIIIRMGFAGYFLIVMDFIHWAKENAIPVGPGRGSGAGSLVAYVLFITDLDPIEYDLLFERFLNPERVSMPDFDIDFCMEGRDKVIDYVTQKYGAAAVSQIITFGTMAAKAVVRDVTRVQGKPYGLGDKIAKLIPFEIGMTLEKSLKQEPLLQQFYDGSEEVREVIDMSFKLEGLTRNVGRHAGGVVIAPSKLTDFTALYCEESGLGVVTQFDKDDVEKIGLVKFDFLGLRTLTIIDWALKLIREKELAKENFPEDFTRLSLDDKSTYDMLCEGKTTAVFQLESRGMKDLIKRLEPTRFEEIIALVALFRPGPLQSGMVDDFINRKHGLAKIEYPHPDLEIVLKNTYGVILYQEQVMQIAQILAGYSLGEADILRRAMGKKKPEEMAKQRTIFLDGCKKNKVNQDQASQIFDLMEKFAGYGFNKSHSAAYALLSYQTAWLKKHYPEAFMAAVLSADMHNTDKIVQFIDAYREELNLTVHPPSINTSEYKFTLNESGEVVYGLGAIKGVGQGPVDDLVRVRKQEGEFSSLFDVCRRSGLKKLSKRILEALIKSGTMDEFGVERASLVETIDSAIKAAEQSLQNSHAGMSDLFVITEQTPETVMDYLPAKKWSKFDRLQAEKETLGLYLTGHPIEQYQSELMSVISAKIVEMRVGSKLQTIAGFVTQSRVLKNKRGQQMAFLTIDDQSARIDVGVFADVYEQYRSLIRKDKLLIISGEIDQDDYTDSLKMRVTQIREIDEIRQKSAKAILIDCLQMRDLNTFPSMLATTLKKHTSGSCPIVLKVKHNHIVGEVKLGDQWFYQPSENLLNDLRQLCGDDAVEVIYDA